MVSTLLPRVKETIVLEDTHLSEMVQLRAFHTIDVTEQPEKAPPSILVTFSGMVIEVKRRHL